MNISYGVCIFTTVITARLAESVILNESRELNEHTIQQIREDIARNVAEGVPESIKKQITEVRRELEKLKRTDFCTEQMIDSLRNLIVDMKDQVDNSILENSNNSRTQVYSRSRLPSTQLRNEADIVRGGIERSVKLISQLIRTEIIDSNDLSLI